MRRAIRDFVEDLIESLKEEPFSPESDLKRKIAILITQEIQGRNRILYETNEFLRKTEHDNKNLKEAQKLSGKFKERAAKEVFLSEEFKEAERLQRELLQIAETNDFDQLEKIHAKLIEILKERKQALMALTKEKDQLFADHQAEILEENRQIAEDDAAAGIKPSSPGFFKQCSTAPKSPEKKQAAGWFAWPSSLRKV